jgi:aspartate racemase
MHRKIGILGGMSPESTVTYYEHITRAYTQRFGDYGYPEVLIYSVNFQRFVDWQHAGQWQAAAAEMARGLESLRRAGAGFGLIATNTMHIVFDEVQRQVGMPLISIMDATAEAITGAGLRSVGLLGTVFTMRERFFRAHLAAAGIEVRVPDPADQERMNSIIYDELCSGRILEESRAFFLSIVDRLCRQGAQGIVLGCTEIPLLVRQEHCAVPVFNTTILHADSALRRAIAPEN